MKQPRVCWKQLPAQPISHEAFPNDYGSDHPERPSLLPALLPHFLPESNLSQKYSEIIIYNWAFCFSKPQGRGALWLKYRRSVESQQAGRSLSPQTSIEWSLMKVWLVWANILMGYVSGQREQYSPLLYRQCSKVWKITAGLEVSDLTKNWKTRWDSSGT